MIVSFHEGACIRAQAGETTVVFSPVSKRSKRCKPVNFGADIAFISLNDPDMNGAAEAARGEREPFIVYGPGEYEIQGIEVAAFPTASKYAGVDRINTIYAMKFDGISVLYLGAISNSDLPAD